MNTKHLEIFEYITKDGRNPFRDWFEKIENKTVQGAIITRLGRVRLGNIGDFKSLKNGLFELRIHLSPGYRIYFARVFNSNILLLLGGQKNTQIKDIRSASVYLNDFLEREGNEKK